MSNKVILIGFLILVGGFFFNKFTSEQEQDIEAKALAPSKIKRPRPVIPTVTPENSAEVVKSKSIDQQIIVADSVLRQKNVVEDTPPKEYQIAKSSLYETPKEPIPDPSIKAVDHEFINLRQEIETKMGDTRTSIFTACKCFVKFEIIWDSFQSTESLRKAGYTVDNFNQAMRSYCADEGAPVACNIKSVRVSYGSETNLNWSGGTADFTTNGVTFKAFDDVVKLIKP